MTDYTHFASVYDAFMEEAPYDKWVSFTKDICKKHQLSPDSIVDLGCGTGEIALRLADEGYAVTGVDMAQDMLTIAEQKSQLHSQRISWVHQDIRTLTGMKQMDLAVSYCDVMNYITEEDEINQTFKGIYDCLRHDGLFIFDIHGMQYVENALVEHTFSDVNDQMAYIWNCFGGESAGEMFHELTFFVKQNEGYRRFDEDHHQRTYETSFYTKTLQQVGFSKIEIYTDFSVKNQNQEQSGERIFIVAQKQSR